MDGLILDVMEKKYKETTDHEQSLLNEGETFQYQKFSDINGKVSKEELARDCLTLEESRKMLFEMIHRHFHSS